jgi:selenide,water dikinase
MASGSGVALRLETSALRVIDGVHDLAARDVVPGGSKANLRWVEPNLTVADGLARTWPIVLADAQTNGGLLAAIDPARKAEVLAALAAAGVEGAAVVGEVLEGPSRLLVR